jgi:hypothetical protein
MQQEADGQSPFLKKNLPLFSIILCPHKALGEALQTPFMQQNLRP